MPSELERFNERMQAFFAPLWWARGAVNARP